MEIRLATHPNEIYNFPHLEEIHVYGNGVDLFHTDSGYLEEFTTRTNAHGNDMVDRVYDGRPSVLYLNNPIKRANKLNLSRKDNFYLNTTTRLYDRAQVLYIHVSEIAVTDLGDRLAMETDNERNYLHAFQLTFQAGVTFNRCHAEKIPCGGDWKIPDNGRWSECYGTEEKPCYYPYDTGKSHFARPDGVPAEKGVVKRWTTAETVPGYSMLTCERYYTRTEYSPERIRINHIVDTINSNNIFSRTVSHYDIEKLLKYFNITEKDGNGK